MTEKKGLSLITLAITIIIIIILAGAVIFNLLSSGFFLETREAKFKSDMKNFEHSLSLNIFNELLKDPNFNQGGIIASYNPIDSTHKNILDVIPEVKGKYEQKIEVESSRIVYSGNDYNEKVWTCEIGMNVKAESCDDLKNNDGEQIIVEHDSIVDVGGVKHYQPNIGSFNKETTFYVKYNLGFEEKISIKEEPPEDWYNYAEQQWANILIENNGKSLYLTWIPRFAYQIPNYVNKSFSSTPPTDLSPIDIRFVDKGNKDLNNGENTVYNDSTPIIENNSQTNFVLHPAFRVSRADTEQDVVELSGMWVSKFESTDIKLRLTGLTLIPQMDGTSVNIEVVAAETSGVLMDGYEYYINDDESPIKVGTANETLTELLPNTIYTIKVRARDAAGFYTNYLTKSVTTITAPVYTVANQPDLTGFNKDTTYYISYENGIENKVSINNDPPSDWYNYNNREWANIMTENNGRQIYLVWIPRYEYQLQNIISTYGVMDIKFTNASKTVADEGYIIHPAFIVNREDVSQEPVHLPGIWVSKFESTDIKLRLTSLSITPQIDGTSVKVDVTKPETSAVLIDGYEYYLNDDVNPVITGTASEIITGLSPNTIYTISVRARDSSGLYTNYVTSSVTTISAPIVTDPNPPDLTGFNKDVTYYVTYENGVENIVSINNEPPNNWYNYTNKEWANIMTENNGRKMYLVWIPRYEYQKQDIVSAYGIMDIRFIDRATTVASQDYIIHPAFILNRDDTSQETIHLPGIWVSKFESTDIQLKLTSITATAQVDGRSINVSVSKPSTSIVDGEGYEYYLNNDTTPIKIGTASEKITGLLPNTIYTIRVKARNSEGLYTNYVTTSVTTLNAPVTSIANAPDMTGFNKDVTYYVTYENGVENKISTNNAPPSNWYNYDNKQWANIMTENNGRKLYLVWIPRYEYQLQTITSTYGVMDIMFIEKTKTVASPGYIIHPAFIVNRDDTSQGTVHLPGIWVSKFEATDIQLKLSTLSGLTLTPQIDGVSIKADVTKPSTSEVVSDGYEYYLNDDTTPIKVGTANEIITGLQPNTVYTISVRARDASGLYTNYVTQSVTTISAPISTVANPPDLTGFNRNTTYYVTYDGSTEITTSINNLPPSNWYNYENKEWANIVTENNGKKLYLVWIPRYEYQIQDVTSTYGVMDIRFISANKTVADSGYMIHPAFIVNRDDTVEDRVHLPGIWVSKFESTDIQLKLNSMTLTPQIDGRSVKVDVTKPSTSGVVIDGYEYYLNDDTSPIKVGTANEIITGLLPNTIYTIRVRGRDATGLYTNYIINSVTTLDAPVTFIANPPDLTGFNLNVTYYLTYENGVENKTSANNPPPSNWYNYENKQWANIVTENNGKKLYLVWIPRYQYKKQDVTSTYGVMDIRFIDTNKTVADDGYILHPAFIVNLSDDGGPIKHISGIWVSKFEATDTN